MKKLSAALLVTALSLGSSATVLASERPAYLGVSYYQMTQDEDRFFGEDDFSTGELMVRFGGRVTSWLSTEWRAGRTISPEEVDDDEFLHRYMWGVYARLGIPLGRLHPYILGGYTRGQEVFKDDVEGTSKGRFGEYSYGVGLDVDVTRSIGVNIEYFHIYDVNSVTLDGPGMGLYWRF